jgi:GTP-binding protein EngB required for normal cell division
LDTGKKPGYQIGLFKREMDDELTEQLSVVRDVVKQFELVALEPLMRACESLAHDGPIDLAVLGQFKSGKSSLLNTVLGEPILPVGVLPLTSVVTRLVAGSEAIARVTYHDGHVECVPIDRIADFVTGTGNPANARQVAVVDVVTPLLRCLPGVRLVDTPGLGSAFVHNSDATRVWLPNLASAIVAVSSERPLSDEDLELIADSRQVAPRVVVVLTKIDLLTEAERRQVVEYLDETLRDRFDGAIPILAFSVRAETDRWLKQLFNTVLSPTALNVARERRAALLRKLARLKQSCCGYLALALEAAHRSEADRERLRAAVFDEHVGQAITCDELALAEQSFAATVRPTFEAYFMGQRQEICQRLSAELGGEISSWRGNLATQSRHYETWLNEKLFAELTPASEGADGLACELMDNAERRFRRIVEAFRDRLNRNVREATGIELSPMIWEVKPPGLAAVPVKTGQTFMVHWDLLWWALPMTVFGAVFRRHAFKRLPGEIETNLRRLVSEWSNVASRAVAELRSRADDWVDTELQTLDRSLSSNAGDSENIRGTLRRLEGVALNVATVQP